MEAITREEQFMAAAAGQAVELPEPITREEMFLAAAAGQNVNLPEPITRREKLLSAIVAAVAGGGTGGSGGGTVEAVLEELTITENGEYTPGAGVDGFSKVIAAIEASGGVTIQSGSFTPAENLFEYEIALTSPVKNFVYQKEAKELSAGVRTNVAFVLIEGLYGFGLSTNVAGTALSGVHEAYENGIKISDDGLTITLDRLISGSQFVTEQYNWVAW